MSRAYLGYGRQGAKRQGKNAVRIIVYDAFQAVMVMTELTGQMFKDATAKRRSVLTALPIGGSALQSRVKDMGFRFIVRLTRTSVFPTVFVVTAHRKLGRLGTRK